MIKGHLFYIISYLIPLSLYQFDYIIRIYFCFVNNYNTLIHVTFIYVLISIYFLTLLTRFLIFRLLFGLFVYFYLHLLLPYYFHTTYFIILFRVFNMSLPLKIVFVYISRINIFLLFCLLYEC